MTLSRRKFLSTLAQGLACSTGMMLPRLSLAAANYTTRKEKKVIVHLFLSGGLDGLSVLVPTSIYSAYTQLRNTSFATGALSATSSDPATRMVSVPGVSGYGFHNQLGFTSNLLNPANTNPFKLALFNWVGHCPRGGSAGHSGSHAEASNMYERGLTSATGIAGGWLGRTADLICAADDPFALVSLCGVSGDAKGRLVTPLSVAPNSFESNNIKRFTTGFENLVDDGFYLMGGKKADNFTDLLAKMRSAETPQNEAATRTSAVWTHTGAIAEDVAKIQSQVVSADYTIDALGAQFKGAAQILKAGFNPAAITLKHGGYDMHSGLLTGLATNLGSLDTNLEAFLLDLIAMGRQHDVTILIETEFGRRNYMNSANGADHGGGALTMVLGTKINRGIFGRQYRAEDITKNFNLAEEIDFREIRTQLLTKHLGLTAAQIGDTLFPLVSGAVPYNPSAYSQAL